jgi:SecD/SecF fusion protein
VLYFYGTGPVKGFAVTLFIGNVIALFSAVFVTRNIMELVVRIWRSLPLYAAPVKRWFLPNEILNQSLYFRYIERTALWLVISLVVIIGGAAIAFINAGTPDKLFNLGLDYTGGEQLVLKATNEFALDGQDVAGIVKKYAEGEAVVQVDQTDPHVVSIRMRVPQTGATEKERSDSRTSALRQMKEEIGNAFGGFSVEGEAGQNPEVVQLDYVGPPVDAELIRNAILSLQYRLR